jgi:hypothetical protein
MAAVNALQSCDSHRKLSSEYERSGMLIGEPDLQVFEAVGGLTFGEALHMEVPA